MLFKEHDEFRAVGNGVKLSTISGLYMNFCMVNPLIVSWFMFYLKSMPTVIC